jgi:outer membrane receptor protein involved in Fe transport
LSAFTSFAQNKKHLLNGKIIDAHSKEALPYVTVIAKTKAAVFVEGTATDNEGKYQLSLPKGEYTLHFSFIGYQNLEKAFSISANQALNIELQHDSEVLETVVVSEERTSVVQKIDRKVINVGKDLQAGGGDAVEVLNQLAEVQTTDDGNIELRGSGNVNVLINGKPSPLEPKDVLQQIDASEIQQIELITTPSAKHRADGLTGIINIITKKKKQQGFSGTLTGSLSSNQQYRSGLAIANGSEKVNLRLNLNFADNETESKGQRSRHSTTLNYDQIGDNLFDGQVKSIKGGLDWFLDEKNEFSFTAGYTDNSHDIINTNQIQENEAAPYPFISKNYHAHISSEYNVNYRRIFKNKDHFLEADFHLTDNKNDLSADYQAGENFRDDFLNYDTKISNVSLDYVQPLNALDLTLETGLLYTYKDVTNDQAINDYDGNSFQNLFTFDEESIGLYTLIKKNWGKLKSQFGLRYEGFWSDSQFENTELQVSRNFHNLFPSVHLTYSFTDKNSFNFGYNRRITRPNLWHVNPFSNAFDRFYNRQGNPTLNPEFSHNFELNFSNNFKFWSFNPGIFYRYKTDLILPFYLINDDDTVLSSYTNDGSGHAYGTEINLALFPLKFLRTTINANFYWEKINTNQVNDFGFLQLNRDNWTIKNLFKINKKLSLDISWIYRGSSTRRYTKSVRMQKFDVALRWKILKGKGNLNLRVTDVFDTYEREQVLYGQGYEENSFRKWETQIAYLSFSYQFSKGKIGKKRNRKNRRFNEPGSTE